MIWKQNGLSSKVSLVMQTARHHSPNSGCHLQVSWQHLWCITFSVIPLFSSNGLTIRIPSTPVKGHRMKVRYILRPWNHDVELAVSDWNPRLVLKWWHNKLEQGHPTTVFCKISVRKSKYYLEFPITWGWLEISRWLFHSCTIFKAYLINSLRFSEV